MVFWAPPQMTTPHTESMLIAGLTVALGILLTLPAAWLVYVSTKAIPNASSGADAPELFLFAGGTLFVYGALLLVAGLVALRWPSVGRWAIVLAGTAPLFAAAIIFRGSLAAPLTWALILPPLALAICAALH